MKHVKDKMIPAVLILVLLVIWEAAVDLLHIPLYVLPSPLEVVKALFTEGTELFSHWCLEFPWTGSRLCERDSILFW